MALVDANGLPVHKFSFAITAFSLWDYAEIMQMLCGKLAWYGQAAHPRRGAADRGEFFAKLPELSCVPLKSTQMARGRFATLKIFGQAASDFATARTQFAVTI